MRARILILGVSLLASLPAPAGARDADDDRIRGLQADVDRLQREVRTLRTEAARLRTQRPTTISVRDDSGVGVTLLLCGAFCALWAQNTGRNAWLWFFAGVIFSMVTLVVLLAKNSGDRGKSTVGGHLS